MHRRLPAAVPRLLLALAGTALLGVPAAGHAQSGTLSISAAVLSKSNCKFSSNTAMALNFGTIDPTASGPYTATATKSFSCQGSAPLATFAVSIDNGQHSSGGVRRMQHGTLTTEFLPYLLDISPQSGTLVKNVAQTLTVTATITQSQYQDAYVGLYSDTVSLTLSP